MSILQLLRPEEQLRLFRVHMTHEDALEELQCVVSGQDAKMLGLKEGSIVKLSTSEGYVHAHVKINSDNPSGLLFVPMHPTVTALISILDAQPSCIIDQDIKVSLRTEDTVKS